MRTSATNALLRNYVAILTALERIREEHHDDCGHRVNGLVAQLKGFDIFFGSKLSYLLFSGTKQTSISHQKKNTTVQEALTCADMAKPT